MYLIVGLGNPESDYAKTRHNMGFNVINELSKELNFEVNKSKFESLFGNTIINGEKVLFLKPQTYMNCSGKAVAEAMNFYKISKQELIVIYDDVDIEPGYIRIRKSGSAGSHKGMKSVIDSIGTEDFCRVRVGIGKPSKNTDIISYVIGYVPENEMEEMLKGVEKAKDAVKEILKNGIDCAMNKYNKRKMFK